VKDAADVVPFDGAMDAVDTVDAPLAVDEGVAEVSVTLGVVQAAVMHASWAAINCLLRER
jgi:hypothetical protein